MKEDKEKKNQNTEAQKNVKRGGLDSTCDEKQSPAVPAGDRGVGLIEATQRTKNQKSNRDMILLSEIVQEFQGKNRVFVKELKELK